MRAEGVAMLRFLIVGQQLQDIAQLIQAALHRSGKAKIEVRYRMQASVVTGSSQRTVMG